MSLRFAKKYMSAVLVWEGNSIKWHPLENHCQPSVLVGWQWFSWGCQFQLVPSQTGIIHIVSPEGEIFTFKYIFHKTNHFPTWNIEHLKTLMNNISSRRKVFPTEINFRQVILNGKFKISYPISKLFGNFVQIPSKIYLFRLEITNNSIGKLFFLWENLF